MLGKKQREILNKKRRKALKLYLKGKENPEERLNHEEIAKKVGYKKGWADKLIQRYNEILREGRELPDYLKKL